MTLVLNMRLHRYFVLMTLKLTSAWRHASVWCWRYLIEQNYSLYLINTSHQCCKIKIGIVPNKNEWNLTLKAWNEIENKNQWNTITAFFPKFLKLSCFSLIAYMLILLLLCILKWLDKLEDWGVGRWLHQPIKKWLIYPFKLITLILWKEHILYSQLIKTMFYLKANVHAFIL